MNKKNLKQTSILLNEALNEPNNSIYSQWYKMSLDIIDSKLFKPPCTAKKKAYPKNICKIMFDSKAIELINLPRIFNDSTVKEVIPNLPSKFEIPTVVYTLTETIGSKIFNFNKFVNNLDVNSFINDNTSLPCHCNGSRFVDQHHQHIITGNLKIITNNKLRKLFSKGPKYREGRNISFDKARENIISGITSCIDSWCNKHGYNSATFLEWKTTVILKVDDKITELINKNHSVNKRQLLKETSVLKDLQELHKKFVVVPIDKASGNVAFICQRHYANVLINELGLINASANQTSTYGNITKPIDKIVSDNSKFLKSKFNLEVTETNRKLPNIYWTPKLHKTPSKARFIIAAPRCSVKPLSKAVTAALKLIYKQIENYNYKTYFYSGVKTFWSIQNNQPAINAINKLNSRNRAGSISTFDFSTLYTNIPHHKLKSVMSNLINFCFHGGDKEYIAVTNFGAIWTNDKDKYKINFSKTSLKLAINYLLDNCYFTLGTMCFRQLIGIPMGSDPAPFMANLFLYYFENKWLQDTKKRDLQKARMFSNTFRFIDDLCALNDKGEFERNCKQIYPEELELKKENIGHHEASFLDLSIKIANKKFTTKLFDKRDSFPFYINRMPFLDSNMPSKIFYASIGSEILRIVRTTTELNDLKNRVDELLTRMKKQGTEQGRLVSIIKKLFGRHTLNFKKFADTAQDFLKLFSF